MNNIYHLRMVAVPDVSSLHQMCWPHTTEQIVYELVSRVTAMQQRKRGLGLVACVDQGVIGYGQLTVWPRIVELSDLIIHPDYRNQGIGTAIIMELIEQARQMHLSKIEIGATLNNPRAIALYRRLGFEDDRIIELNLGKGLQPVLYLKQVLHHTQPMLCRQR